MSKGARKSAPATTAGRLSEDSESDGADDGRKEKKRKRTCDFVRSIKASRRIRMGIARK